MIRDWQSLNSGVTATSGRVGNLYFVSLGPNQTSDKDVVFRLAISTSANIKKPCIESFKLIKIPKPAYTIDSALVTTGNFNMHHC